MPHARSTGEEDNLQEIVILDDERIRMYFVFGILYRGQKKFDDRRLTSGIICDSSI